MKIDFSQLKDIQLKDLKNRKELLVLLAIIIFAIAFLLVGNNLLTENGKANDELKQLKMKYDMIIKKENSVEVLSAKIDELNSKILTNESATETIDEAGIIGILEEMQKNLGVTWDKKNRTISEATKVEDVEGILKFKVTISSFSVNYTKAKAIMAYVKGLDQKVSVESFTVSKNPLTGEFRGNMVLNFYTQQEVSV